MCSNVGVSFGHPSPVSLLKCPEVVKEYFFPGHLNNSVSWYGIAVMLTLLCAQVLSLGAQSTVKHPALRGFADHVFHFWMSEGMRYHHKQGSHGAVGQEKMVPKRMIWNKE